MLLASRPAAANFDGNTFKTGKTDMSENVDRLLEIMAKLPAEALQAHVGLGAYALLCTEVRVLFVRALL